VVSEDLAGRVPRLDDAAARGAAEGVGVLPQLAELNIFRALLHQPDVAKCINDLLLTLLFRGGLEGRLRELVIMRLGWATASDYEWTQHWRVARELGVPSEDLLAVRDWRESDRFSPADRAVLAATDETLAGGAITPETFADCERHVGGPAVLVELVVAIGTWRMISSIARSLAVPLEDGVSSWPPDERGPAA
jgi:alkylhydroperoxidase family enzyme